MVEGDSAALAVLQVRDSRLQAVLPMRGKPLNALRASDGKVGANPFLRALTNAIGPSRGAAFDLEALRYDRIVLLMDPDADGIHAGALLLLYFHRWMPLLVERGFVERVHAPLGEVRAADGGRHFAYTEPQFRALNTELRASGPAPLETLRYRGLAGIDAGVLAERCVDRGTRHGRILTPDDARTAMDVFASLRELPPQGSLF